MSHYKGPYRTISGITRTNKGHFNIVVSDDEICDHASPELFKIRKQINQKHNAIRDKLSHIVGSVHYQKYLQENIITIRGGIGMLFRLNRSTGGVISKG